MNTIEQIESQGIAVSFYYGKIKLMPIEKVTPAIVVEVKANRAQIIQALNSRISTVQAARCYCCGGQTFWRKKDNMGGRWICKACHPPLPSKDEIVWLQ